MQSLNEDKLYAQGSFDYRSYEDKELEKINFRPSMPIGITKIDEDFSFPSGYYVLCGNPGTGKGFFALWLSQVFFLYHKATSVYFSLEMDEPLVRQRILQQWSHLTETEHKNGKGVEKAINLLKLGAIRVDIFHSDNPKYQTPDRFKEKIEYYYFIGFRVFHFDHLHEIEGMTANDTNQGVSEEWAKAFQDVCKAHSDIWLFVYTQPNGQAAKKKILTKTDISGSKVISQKCEFFLSLNRTLAEKNGEFVIDEEDRTVILWLDKNRIGSKSHIGFRLYFSHTGNYFDVTPREDEFTKHVVSALM